MKIVEHVLEEAAGLLLGAFSFGVMVLMGVVMFIPNWRRYEHIRHM